MLNLWQIFTTLMQITVNQYVRSYIDCVLLNTRLQPLHIHTHTWIHLKSRQAFKILNLETSHTCSNWCFQELNAAVFVRDLSPPPPPHTMLNLWHIYTTCLSLPSPSPPHPLPPMWPLTISGKCYTGYCPADKLQEVIMVRHLLHKVLQGLSHKNRSPTDTTLTTGTNST